MGLMISILNKLGALVAVVRSFCYIYLEMMTEIKTIEGGQKRCSPHEGQTFKLKKNLFKDNHIFQKHTIQKGFKIH